MRVFRLVPVFLFSLMLCTQVSVVFFPGQAYAWSCCGCNCRAFGCYCPGQGGCNWYPCHTDDSTILQAKTVIDNEILDIRGNYDSRPSPAFRSRSIDQLIPRMSSGQCDKNNFALKFFQSAEDRLTFDPDFLKYNVNQDNSIVVSQMPLNEDR